MKNIFKIFLLCICIICTNTWADTSNTETGETTTEQSIEVPEDYSEDDAFNEAVAAAEEYVETTEVEEIKEKTSRKEKKAISNCETAGGTWQNNTCIRADCGDKEEWDSAKNKCVKKKNKDSKSTAATKEKEKAKTANDDDTENDTDISDTDNTDDITDVEESAPKLSYADSQEKLDELQANVDAMKEKEQSTENKLLGGATMAATGIGGMQAMSALAEKNADEDAETAMRAYLATFRCNFGGTSVAGGERDVQLPGGNELINLYSEYVNLANDLKVRKTALDMRPGIESEPILDAATSGLYDDVSIGKTSGAFTSLARALQNPDGPDAIAWAAQKEETAKQLKTGLITAGVGAAVGIVGNQLINKNAPKENSKEIIEKYKKKLQKAQSEIDTLPSPTCDSEKFNGVSGGTYPDCTCTDENARFFIETGCTTCENGQNYNSDNQCVPNECKLSGAVKANICECIDNASESNNNCSCNKGYNQTNGTCVKAQEEKEEKETEEKELSLVLETDKIFEPGKSDINAETTKKIIETLKNTLDADTIQQISKIDIVGHTDRTQFKTGSNMNNQKLSENRANTIKNLFITAGFDATKITTSGAAESNCIKEVYKKANDARCRRVIATIELVSNSDDISLSDIADKLKTGLSKQNK